MAEGRLFLFVFTDECWGVFVEGLQQLFVKLDVRGVLASLPYYLPCALDIISKTLGYAIVLGSTTLKLPQIYAIVAAESAEGLAPSSFYLDVLVFVVSIAYNVKKGYEFSTYGEQVIVLLQNVVLVGLLWRYARPSLAHVFCVSALGGAACCATAVLPLGMLWVLPTVCISSTIAARLPQIRANAAQRHTGALSGATLKLNALGALARVFTTLQSSADPVVLLGFGMSLLFNVILIAQIRFYRTNTARLLDKPKAH
ncbi:hypothetical protein M885DRAFT_531251 [Pelagophyceae sp. CCMP2097]|nr:hypothetical protein M885DRAFT_531251 [Pelagophyceae sp. CCMP2097]